MRDPLRDQHLDLAVRPPWATRSAEAATALAGFLAALHRPAPEHAPSGRGRGGSLADHSEGGARGWSWAAP